MNRNGELAIYEVYYEEDGTVGGYSADPPFPAGETLDELRKICHRYLAALEKPVLIYEVD